MLEGAAYATERARDFVSGTTTVLSKARSIVSGDALFFSVAPKIDDLRFALASDSLFEKRDAMKKIVAQMCKGVDMHALFPDVVKNIHASSTELRKLIYLFVVHYAEDCPNEALLSISAFQKDLVDPSMHVRSLALRMLSAMQIPAIHPVVMLAVKKGASDGAVIVRKTAAIALWQMCCVSQRDTDMTSLYDVLRELLNDKAPDVVGAAVMSFERICKHRVDLIHPVYRHLCEILPDCEEWGQDVILRVLLRYVRGQFCDPTKPRDGASGCGGSGGNGTGDEDSVSSSSGSSSSSDEDDLFDRAKRKSQTANGGAEEETPLDPDHQLLLTAARPLLFSLSSAVVVGVCALYRHCAPPRYLDYCVKPLMRVLGSAKEGHGTILNAIYCLLEKRPEAFTPYIKEFYLLSQDSADVRALKHRILSRLATKENLMDLFQEYKSYVRGVNEESVAEAIRGLGFIVSRHPSFSNLTMRLLTPLLSRSSAAIVTEAVAVLRLLVMQGKGAQGGVRLVFQLAQEVVDEKVTTPSAVATVLWLVGESLRFHPAVAAAAPDCFRVLVQRFASLKREVKQEVLTLGCKIWLQLDEETSLAQRFRKMFFYALELARYDDDYLIRDQARLLEGTCDRDSDVFRAIKDSLEGEKPLPLDTDPFAERARFELGTLSNVFGSPVLAYEDLPAWRTETPDASLRRPARVAGSETATRATASSTRASRAGDAKRPQHNTLWSSSSSSSAVSSEASEDEGKEESRKKRGFYSDEDEDEDDESSTESDGDGSGDAVAQENSSASSRSSSPSTDSSSAASPAAPRNGSATAPAKPVAIKMIVKRLPASSPSK